MANNGSPPRQMSVDLPVNGKQRLPPRSRNGCWTCRVEHVGLRMTRKVKCDEMRPVCGQCSRLNHRCDYKARINWRDNNESTIGRISPEQHRGSPVWDPESERLAAIKKARDIRLAACAVHPGSTPPEPFEALNSDEQREIKATAKKTASYFVVYTEETFKDDDSDDEEDCDPHTFEPTNESADLTNGNLDEGLTLEDKVTFLMVETERLSKAAEAPALDVSPEMYREVAFLPFDLPLQIPQDFQVSVDEDTLSMTFDGTPKHVIVKKMEEPLTHAPNFDNEAFSHENSFGYLPSSSRSHSPYRNLSPNPDEVLPHGEAMIEDTALWAAREAEMNPQQRTLVEWYRYNLSPRLMKYHDLGVQRPIGENGRKCLDPFLNTCLKIPEVFPALLAFAAKACLAEVENSALQEDAMNYYLESFLHPDTITAKAMANFHDENLHLHVLRLHFEIFSGGSYTVMDGKPGWQVQLDNIRQVYTMQMQVVPDSNPLFQHYLYTIDAYATLTAGGTGDLITTLANQARLPAPSILAYKLQQSIRPLFPSTSNKGEKLVVEEIEAVMDFHQKTVLLTSKIGLAGQRLRTAKVNEQAKFFEDFDLEKIMLPEFGMEAQERRDEVDKMASELKAHGELKPPPPSQRSPNRPELDDRVREIFWHSTVLHFSLVIFLHTSMYATQRQEITLAAQEEVNRAVRGILSVARQLLERYMRHNPPESYDVSQAPGLILQSPALPVSYYLSNKDEPGFGDLVGWTGCLTEPSAMSSSSSDALGGDLTYDLPFTTFDPSSLSVPSFPPPPASSQFRLTNPNSHVQCTVAVNDPPPPPPELRFLLFPLFLAGVETKDSGDRMWVSDVLTFFERGSLSPVSQTMKRVLERVDFLRMKAEFNTDSEGNHGVDWLAVLNEEDGRVIFWDV